MATNYFFNFQIVIGALFRYHTQLSLSCSSCCTHLNCKKENCFSGCLTEKKNVLGHLNDLTFTKVTMKTKHSFLLNPHNSKLRALSMMLLFIGLIIREGFLRNLVEVRVHSGIRGHVMSKRNDILSFEPSTCKTAKPPLCLVI